MTTHQVLPRAILALLALLVLAPAFAWAQQEDQQPVPAPTAAPVEERKVEEKRTVEEKRVNVQIEQKSPETPTTTTTTEVWYVSPTWLAVGGLAVIVLILLVAMAARGGSSEGPTIVKQ
jgi:cytoskeletal protein RodZ